MNDDVSMISNPNYRHDFVVLFDVSMGNPNGDPDAGNLPRMDPENGLGLVSDGCIKRKIRNYVQIKQGSTAGYAIYVQDSGIALNTLHASAYTALGLKSTGKKQKRAEQEQARAWMCANFYDVRTFGAVMTTGVNCGQVRGPVQIGISRSVDPITVLDMTITRVAVTRQEDIDIVESDDGGQEGKTSAMGKKPLVLYGLYLAAGHIVPHFAAQTGFSAADLSLLWEAMSNMWSVDYSAARGEMSTRGIYIFSHDSPLGRAPAHRLFARLSVERRNEVEAPRRFEDYVVSVDASDMPAGVTLTQIVD